MGAPKQAIGGAALLAIGLAIGVAVAPDEPQRDDKVADVAPPTGKPLDAAEYHRTVTAARGGRSDVTDLLTGEVPPGESVTAVVNVEPGARPATVEYTGAAAGHFETVLLAHEDRGASTHITFVARNSSTETLRLTALVHLTKGP